MTNVLAACLGVALLAAVDPGHSVTFQKTELGVVPNGWKVAKTGQWEGSVWKVVADDTTPSGSGHALAQVAKGPDALFNLCVLEKSDWKDLELSVKLKSVSGKEDQGGGVVWRYRDADNYYICRVNPLEENFRVYRVVDGKRSQLATTKNNIDAPAGQWHTLSIQMQGNRIECSLNGKLLLEATDDTFKEGGKVGLWTKADAETRFDQFTVRPVSGSSAPAGEISWVGKKILPKRIGMQLGSSPLPKEQSPVAVLRITDHVVMEQRGQRLCLRQQGVGGWLNQDDVVRLPDAVAYFGKQVEANPNDGVALHARGMARLLSSDPDGALQDLAAAIKLLAGGRAALFEPDPEPATPLPVQSKPFDFPAEGLLSENSRGDKTAIELFIAGIRGWEAGLRQHFPVKSPSGGASSTN